MSDKSFAGASTSTAMSGQSPDAESEARKATDIGGPKGYGSTTAPGEPEAPEHSTPNTAGERDEEIPVNANNQHLVIGASPKDIRSGGDRIAPTGRQVEATPSATTSPAWRYQDGGFVTGVVGKTWARYKNVFTAAEVMVYCDTDKFAKLPLHAQSIDFLLSEFGVSLDRPVVEPMPEAIRNSADEERAGLITADESVSSRPTSERSTVDEPVHSSPEAKQGLSDARVAQRREPGVGKLDSREDISNERRQLVDRRSGASSEVAQPTAASEAVRRAESKATASPERIQGTRRGQRRTRTDPIPHPDRRMAAADRRQVESG